MSVLRLAAVSLLALLSGPACAHSFGQVYNLPVPFWLYGWSAAAVLAVSFLITAYFVSGGETAHESSAGRELRAGTLALWLQRLRLLSLIRSASVMALLLCIATGLWGSNSPYGNFNMTFFWIVFLLGFAYITALIGNWYVWINPWRVLSDWLGRLWPGYLAGRWVYPHRLGSWPAVVLYVGFIWLELLGGTTPFSLAVWLCAYTVFNLLGIGLLGQRSWLRHVEFFGLFFDLIARMAPLEVINDGKRQLRIRLRWPFAGLLNRPVSDYSQLAFILFMLSSTAFDGLHETIVWLRFFWEDLYHAVLINWVGSNPLAAFPAMNQWLLVWQSFWLVVWGAIYCLVYLCFMQLSRWMARGAYSWQQMAYSFVPSLLPIALVYNISHYYTLIETQGVKIVTLASDPFGYGWDLFGTADWLQLTIIPNAAVVWHAQVGLILVGHIVSVVVAHKQALAIFDSRRQALMSQMPMLLLMVFFTVAGLWVLSQPVAGVA